MEWTRELRYKNYNEWPQEYIDDILKKAENSVWKNSFHIEPQSGLLNDPNGFSYFNGKWHLFYQHFPYGASHGLKSWSHVTSDDLINWQLDDIQVLPDTKFDSHGAYSGSAYEIDGKLFLFYTGNHRDQNWTRHPYQVGALMDSNGDIKKFDQPLINPDDNYTDHFRDPMIFEYEDKLYMILGAQRKNKTGAVVLYEAINNNIENWKKVDELKFTNLDLGYMVECPNLVFVDEKPVLLLCPQGMDKTDSKNIYPQTYVIGETFNPQTAEIVNPQDMKILDYGFDVYASQAFNAPNGMALMTSWLGLPDISYPTDELGHQGAMSLVKELTIKDGNLYQYPVKSVESLRKNTFQAEKFKFEKNAYETEIIVEAHSNAEITFYGSDDNKQGLKLILENGKAILNRSKCGIQFALEYDNVRTFEYDNSKDLKINAFVDASVIEIFFNDGQYASSSRVYPEAGNTIFQVKGTAPAVLHEF